MSSEKPPPESNLSLEQQIFAQRLKILNWIVMRLRGDPSGIAEDLTQEVLMNATKSIDTFDPKKGNLNTWLFKIAKNTVYSYFRYIHSGIRNQSLTDQLGDDHDSIPHPGVSPEKAVIHSEQMSILQTMIAKLPERIAKTMTLHLSGKSNKDIATTLEIPPGTVKSDIHRGKELLEKQAEK